MGSLCLLARYWESLLKPKGLDIIVILVYKLEILEVQGSIIWLETLHSLNNGASEMLNSKGGTKFLKHARLKCVCPSLSGILKYENLCF